MSFTHWHVDAATVLPVELSVLMVGVAARQAGSPAATLHVALSHRPAEARLLSPAEGAFNSAVAAALARWRQT